MLNVRIPFGTAAVLFLPDGGERIHLIAGAYTYTLDMPEFHPFSMMSDWRELLADPRAKAVIESHFPKAIRGIAFQKELQTMDQVVRSPFATLTRETVDLIRRELEEIRD